MKIRRRALTLMLSVILILTMVSAIPSAAAEISDTGICGSTSIYTLFEDGTLIISGTGRIPDYKFDLSDHIKLVTEKLIIEEGISEIGKYAFACFTNLASVEIPQSLKDIDHDAFSGCDVLSGVYIASIADWCEIRFNGEYVGSQTNPLTIAHDLFVNNAILTDLVIPDGITAINNYAFAGCTSIKTVTIPNSVTEIGVEAFAGCSNLVDISIGNNVENIKDLAFSSCSNLQNIVIGDNVKSIGNYAFSYCSNLTDVVIGNNVQSIGNLSFENCTELTNIHIPCSVQEIGYGAFYQCDNVKNVYITDIASWCKIKFVKDEERFYSDLSANPLRTAENLFLDGALVTDLVVPESVEQIRNYAFYGLSCLTNVSITNGVVSIGYGAFASCTELKSVLISDSVTRIGSYSFQNCSELTQVSIPDSVETIGGFSFDGCTNLVDVTLGNAVASLESASFQGCSSLESVSVPVTLYSIGSYSFNDCSSLRDVYYAGSPHQWEIIDFNTGNYPLKAATIHYYSPDKEHDHQVIGHDWVDGEVLKEAGCVTSGLIKQTCSVCGEERELNIPATGAHTPGAPVTTRTAATCTKDGEERTVTKCTVCGEVLDQLIKVYPAGHKLVRVPAVAPTATNEGNIEYYICSVCSKCFADANASNEIDEASAILPKTEEEQQDKCPYCGKMHTGTFGSIVKFFHQILYFFRSLFGG